MINVEKYNIKWVKCRGIELVENLGPKGKRRKRVNPYTTKYGFLSNDKAVDVLIRVDNTNGSVSLSCPHLREDYLGQNIKRALCGAKDPKGKGACFYMGSDFYKDGFFKRNIC